MKQEVYPQAPVLLITFNRPAYTAQVLSSLMDSGVTKLYVFNDGPRDGNGTDQKAREEIKILVNAIGKQCEVHTLFSETNLGCGLGVSSAISWAFEHEDRLIILEDDCIASKPFFAYCDYLLEKYCNDNRVWAISGENHLYPEWAFTESDYIFSQFGFNTGWATWKRCWDHFDIGMKKLADFIRLKGIENVFCCSDIVKTYYLKYGKLDLKIEKPRFWTIQFGFAIVSNRGLIIIPKENMIENIGVEGDHTIGVNEFHHVKTSDSFSIKREPLFVLPDKNVDHWHYLKRIKPMIHGPNLLKKIRRKLKKIIGRLTA